VEVRIKLFRINYCRYEVILFIYRHRLALFNEGRDEKVISKTSIRLRDPDYSEPWLQAIRVTLRIACPMWDSKYQIPEKALHNLIKKRFSSWNWLTKECLSPSTWREFPVSSTGLMST
jgi:hypothetical protein